jgi:hypothetical protein
VVFASEGRRRTTLGRHSLCEKQNACQYGAAVRATVSHRRTNLESPITNVEISRARQIPFLNRSRVGDEARGRYTPAASPFLPVGDEHEARGRYTPAASPFLPVGVEARGRYTPARRLQHFSLRESRRGVGIPRRPHRSSRLETRRGVGRARRPHRSSRCWSRSAKSVYTGNLRLPPLCLCPRG